MAAGLTHPTPARQTRRSAGKAAGSSATEAYSFSTHPPRAAETAQSPGGTLQGDERLRTTLGEKRVSARRGRAGGKRDIFSILLGFFLAEEERSIQPRDGDGDEFDCQQ